LLFTATATFAEVAFIEPSGNVDSLFMTNRVIDIIFFTDMILQFFLMFPATPKSAQETIRWVHDQPAIASNYLKSWFAIDLIPILVSGFDFLSLNSVKDAMAGGSADESEGGGSLQTFRILRIIRVARLVKLVRLVRSSRIMKRLESRMAINYGHLSLFKSLMGVIIAAHWYACLWGLMTGFEPYGFSRVWYTEFGYCRFEPTEARALAVQDAHFNGTSAALGDLKATYSNLDASATAAELYQLELDNELNYACDTWQQKCAPHDRRTVAPCRARPPRARV
jgi:hypothetical protein